MKLYHGTAALFGHAIERRGLNPEGTGMGPNMGKSTYSAPGYVYFTTDLKLAEMFACGMASKVGVLKGQVFETDSRGLPIEEDPALPGGSSWRYKGSIPADKLKGRTMFDCRNMIKEMERLNEVMGPPKGVNLSDFPPPLPR